MTSQTKEPVIAMHIEPNILRNKANQIKAFCQLTEYSVRNFFVQKSYKK